MTFEPTWFDYVKWAALIVLAFLAIFAVIPWQYPVLFFLGGLNIR